MYETFYGFREKPFLLFPDPAFLYLSGKHRAALSLLEYGILNRSGFVVITGEVGTGKSLLLRKIMSEAKEDLTVGLISNTHQNFGRLAPWVLFVFGLRANGAEPSEMFREFSLFLANEQARNRRVVLIVDEAHNLEPSMLEELRLLSNLNGEKEPVLQIILSGQPGLRELLSRSELVQFAQRVDAEYHLGPMDREETIRYIRHRMKTAGRERPLFDETVSSLIYKLTGGVPRLINQLCEGALVYGFAEQAEKITLRIVSEAVSDRMEGKIVPFIDPGNLPSFLREGSAVKAANGSGEGLDRLERPAKKPWIGDADYREGVALRAAGRRDEAIHALVKATRDSDFWLRAFSEAGLCHRDSGRPDEAIRLFRAALSDRSAPQRETAAVRYEMGRTFEELGKLDDALDCYRRIYLVEPDFLDAAARIERLSNFSTLSESWIGLLWLRLKAFLANRRRRSRGKFTKI